MTSIPASRSARAMIFAPRSWPSRPGFAMRTRIFFSSGILCLAEYREDDDIVIRPLAVKIARQLPLLDESVPQEHVLRFLVVVEDVDAELDQVHVVEREADQRPDGVGRSEEHT